MIHNEQDGLYGLSWKDDFLQWFAWFSWRAEALDIVLPLERFTFPLEWPPTSATGVRNVLAHWRAIREEIAKEDRRKSHIAYGWRSLSDDTKPWQEWSEAFKSRLLHAEMQRRLHDGDYFDHAPRYPTNAWEALRLLEKRNLDLESKNVA